MADHEKAPPMIPGDAAGDRDYMESQGVEKAIALAFAQVIREKPPNALLRIAELLTEAAGGADAAGAADAAGGAAPAAAAAEAEAVPLPVADSASPAAAEPEPAS